MKAFLLTKCGCSQVLDIPNNLPRIKLPLISSGILARYANISLQEKSAVREFVYDSTSEIQGTPILIYKEE